jgi:hypothetical protein
VSHQDFDTLVSRGTVPFVIGVTGHLDLKDPGKSESSLTDFFSEWAREMPETPLLLIGSLAEGADQLVITTARRVLGSRVRWATILPFAKERYEKTFESPESRQDFLSLLNSSVQILRPPPESEADLAECDGYCLAGKRIVLHANMLIALWDGRQATNPDGTLCRGGTWDVVRAALEGTLDDGTTSLEPVRTIPVLQVVTERLTPKGSEFIDNLTPEKRQPGRLFLHIPVEDEAVKEVAPIPCQPGKKAWLYAALALNGSPFGNILRTIQAFNHAVCTAESVHAAEIAKSIGYLGLPSEVLAKTLAPRRLGPASPSKAGNDAGVCPGGRTCGEPQKGLASTDSLGDMPDGLTLDMKRFGLCEALANREQALYKRALNIMFAVSFLTGVMGQIYCGLRMTHLFLALYLIGMLLAYGLFILFKNRHIDRVYHDYRALAEALRVHLYWRVAGINESVATFFLRKQRGELEWLRMALQNWAFLHATEPVTPVGTIDEVKKSWVKGQFDYYKDKSEEYFCFSKRIDRVALAFYLLSILLGFFFLFFGENLQFLEKYGSFWLALGPFVLAFIGYYQNKKAWAEHAEAYTSAGRIFWTAQERLKTTPDTLKQQEILYKLGQEALQEHSEWVLVHRKRPPEPMK